MRSESQAFKSMSRARGCPDCPGRREPLCLSPPLGLVVHPLIHLHPRTPPSIYPSNIRPPTYLLTHPTTPHHHPPTHPSIPLSTHPSTPTPTYPPTCPSTHSSPCPSIYPSTHPPAHWPIYPMLTGCLRTGSVLGSKHNRHTFPSSRSLQRRDRHVVGRQPQVPGQQQREEDRAAREGFREKGVAASQKAHRRVENGPTETDAGLGALKWSTYSFCGVNTPQLGSAANSLNAGL